jgi:diguanylate cyclase (GGDEF)-like protein
MEAATAGSLLDLLSGFGSVAAARIGRDGGRIEARGFLSELIAEGNAVEFLKEPAWPALLALGEGGTYRGPLVLAGARGGLERLQGAVCRTGEGFLLVAERMPDDIEQLSKATVRLSNELAQARESLASASRNLGVRDEQLRVISFVDRITGLGNRRAFNQGLAAEIVRVRRYGGPLCLVLASIDGLEGVAGHFGDERAQDIVRCFARVVCNETRQSDHACRFEDNRFMLMLTQTAAERAAHVTERIRLAFAAASPGMVAASVTASFGCAQWREGEDAGSLVDRVGVALATASASGGNRVATA